MEREDRALELTSIAADLRVLAVRCRSLDQEPYDPGYGGSFAISRASDLLYELGQAIEVDGSLDTDDPHLRSRQLYIRKLIETWDLSTILGLNPDFGRQYAAQLDSAALLISRRLHGLAPYDCVLGGRVQSRLLECLARFLPADERARFVAEARGNLGDCGRWWQRADHLVCLAIGMPRLAWMMRRDNRRGRA